MMSAFFRPRIGGTERNWSRSSSKKTSESVAIYTWGYEQNILIFFSGFSINIDCELLQVMYVAQQFFLYNTDFFFFFLITMMV